MFNQVDSSGMLIEHWLNWSKKLIWYGASFLEYSIAFGFIVNWHQYGILKEIIIMERKFALKLEWVEYCFKWSRCFSGFLETLRKLKYIMAATLSRYQLVPN